MSNEPDPGDESRADGGDPDVERAIEVYEREGPRALERWLDGLAHERALEIRERVDLLRGAGLLAREPGEASGDPARIDRFEVLRRLGAGATGLVYLARDPISDALVAVKVLAPQFAQEPRVRERFRRESRATGRLQHENLVAVLEIGEDAGQLYSVLDYVDGTSLEDGLERLRSLDVASESIGADEIAAAFELDAGGRARVGDDLAHAAAAWTRDLALALAHAHEAGVVHRDVKPSNIVIERSGRPRLVDFGLAHVVDDARLTWSGDILGTPKYVAPEVIRDGVGRSDHRVDVFALGVCLYELTTLRAPFDGVSSAQVMQRVVELDPPPPSRSNPRVGRDFDAICAVALAKSPARRFRSAAALADDLARWLEGLPVLARSPGPIEVLWHGMRRRPMASTVGAVLFVSLAATAVLVAVYNAKLERRGEIARAAQLSAETSLSFLVELLELSDVEEEGPDVPARRLLAEGAERVRDPSRWTGQERVRAHVARSLGALSWGAGELPAARDLLDLSCSILAEPPPANVDAAAWALERSLAQNYLGNVLRAQGDVATAIDRYRASLASLEGAARGEPGTRDQEATVCANLADTLAGSGQLEEAEALTRRALAARAGEDEEVLANRASSLVTLARIQMRRGDTTGAATTLDEAGAVVDAMPSKPLQQAGLLDASAQLAMAMGDRTRAVSLIERTAAIFEQVVGPRAPARGEVLLSLGEVLWDDGQTARSERALLAAEEILAADAAVDHVKLPRLYLTLGRCALEAGRPDEAARRAQQTTEAWARHPEWPYRWGDAHAWILRALAESHRGCADDAREALATAERSAQACCPDLPQVTIALVLARARVEKRLGENAVALSAYREALALAEREPAVHERKLEIETELRELEDRAERAAREALGQR